MNIAFICGRQPAIDRSWFPADAAVTFTQHGHKVRTEFITTNNAPSLMRSLKLDNDIVWPTTYTVDSDPLSESVFSLLQNYGIPYVGPSATSARINSKLALHALLDRLGLARPRSVSIMRQHSQDRNYLAQLAYKISVERFALPLVVKAEYSAASVGVDLVQSPDQLVAVIPGHQARYGQHIVVEEWCRKREYTCAVIGHGKNPVIASMEIGLQDSLPIFAHHAKSTYQHVEFLPVEVPKQKHIESLVLTLWRALDRADYGRVDILEDDAGNFRIIDVNFLPGLDRGPTTLSLFPMAIMRALGLQYDETLLQILLGAKA